MKIRWGDLLIFIIIAIIIVGMFISGTKVDADIIRIAEIYLNNEIVYEINLSEIVEETRYPLLDGDVIIIAKKDMIRFETSDCPDLVCVNTGWISKPGQIAVCLPNRILIKISGESSEVDVVIH